MADDKEGQGVEMQMEAPKKTKHVNGVRLITTIILILVTAMVFLGLGFWAGTQQVKNEAVTAVTATVSPTASAVVSGTATADVTANWKTYTNDTYGFSFKYPSDWTVLDNKKDASEDITIKKDSKENPTMLVRVWDGKLGFGWESANFDYKAKLENGKLSIIPVGDIGSAVKKQIEAANGVGPTTLDGDDGTTDFSFGTDRWMFIDTTFKYGGDSYRQTFHDILSTFQFSPVK